MKKVVQLLYMTQKIKLAFQFESASHEHSFFIFKHRMHRVFVAVMNYDYKDMFKFKISCNLLL